MDGAEHLDLEAQPLAKANRPLRRLLLLLAGGLPAAASLLAFAGAWWWQLDLLSHFRFQYAVILSVATMLCLLTRQWVWALLLGVVLGINLYTVVDLYRPTDPGTPLPWLAGWWPDRDEQPAADAAGDGDTDSSLPLRLLSLRAPDQPQVRHAMFDMIATSKADVVVIFNLTEAMAHYVHYSSGPFASKVVQPRDDGFGLAVLIRSGTPNVTLQSHDPVDLTGGGRSDGSAVSLLVQHGDRELAMLIGRLIPPVNQAAADVHQQQVQQMIRWVRDQQHPVVVVTDFSATPWSSRFSSLLDQTGLINSQKGFGVQATWPSTGGPLGKLPIDHVLHSPQLQTQRRRIGPSVGGDRHTLRLKLAWVDSAEDPDSSQPQARGDDDDDDT